MSDDVTPNEMPGADAVTEPSEPTAPAPEPKGEAVAEKSQPKPTETVDFWKGKAREQEKRAKENFEDAQKWRELREKTGAGNDFDPREEIEKLRKDFLAERQARWREEVARVTDVDPEDIKGETREEMLESAKSWKARFEAKLEAALKSKSVPAAAPAAEVTSNMALNNGPKQLTRADLQNMSRKERIEAHKSGQLDELFRGTE